MASLKMKIDMTPFNEALEEAKALATAKAGRFPLHLIERLERLLDWAMSDSIKDLGGAIEIKQEGDRMVCYPGHLLFEIMADLRAIA